MIKAYTKKDLATKVSENFCVADFWTDNGYSELRIDDALFPVCEKILAHYGKCPHLDSKSGSYRPGKSGTYHRYTTALDMRVDGVTAVDLARYLETLPEVAGIGLYATKSERQKVEHVHFDVIRSDSSPKGRRRRTCWWVKTSNSKTPGHGGITTVFRYGHRSMAVYDIQAKLRELGYPLGAPDGIFGPNTRREFKKWQRDVGLKADGAYGKLSNAKMKLFDW